MARFPFIYLWVPPVDKETKDIPEHIAYEKYTARASGEFARVYLRAQTLTPTPSPPTLIITSKTDEVVNKKSGQFLFDRLQNPKNRYVQLTQSSHVVTLGEAKKDVLSEIEAFYRAL
jgi:esterase/lipase